VWGGPSVPVLQPRRIPVPPSEPSPGDVTAAAASALPAGPAAPSGARFCRRRSKTDRIFSSQLPGRHLTFNPHSQWVPNTSLAIIRVSDPARAAAACRPNLKETLQIGEGGGISGFSGCSGKELIPVVGRATQPTDAPSCRAKPGSGFVLAGELWQTGSQSMLPGPTFCRPLESPLVAQPHAGRGPTQLGFSLKVAPTNF
jgi:hypothetical protein